MDGVKSRREEMWKYRLMAKTWNVIDALKWPRTANSYIISSFLLLAQDPATKKVSRQVIVNRFANISKQTSTWNVVQCGLHVDVHCVFWNGRSYVPTSDVFLVTGRCAGWKIQHIFPPIWGDNFLASRFSELGGSNYMKFEMCSSFPMCCLILEEGLKYAPIPNLAFHFLPSSL